MQKILFSLLAAMLVFASGAFQLAFAQMRQPAGNVTKSPAKRVVASEAQEPQGRPQALLPELSFEQLAIADRVELGKMPCELAARVSVKPDARGAGRFILELGSQKYFMQPVPTRTGAIRLEDAVAGVVWLQLSNKSMLMSQKQGKRLADACVSASQRVVAKELERNPAPSLLDAPVLLVAAEPDSVSKFPLAADGAAK